MEKMTIHRALSELKLIGAKIEAGIDAVNPSGVVQKGKLVDNIYPQETFEKAAKEKFQSVVDLITRRNKIKSAIVQANGNTTIKVAGQTMTIADAINLKTVVELKKKFIDTLKKRHGKSKINLEKGNAPVEANALKLAEVALGKQGIKIGDNDAQAVIEPFLLANKFTLVDPLDIEKKIATMEEEVNNFEAEVDAVLSEVNATTFIEF